MSNRVLLKRRITVRLAYGRPTATAADAEAGVMPSEAEIGVRRLFELEDFGEGEVIDRFKTLVIGGAS